MARLLSHGQVRRLEIVGRQSGDTGPWTVCNSYKHARGHELTFQTQRLQYKLHVIERLRGLH